MFEAAFSDGVRRGMAFDSAHHTKHPVYVTKGNSMISKRDWPRLRHALDVELGPRHDLVRQKQGINEDEQPGVAALRKYLHENTGLSEDAIDEACELAARAAEERGEATVEDELPLVSGSGDMGGRLSDRSRSGGAKVFLGADDEAERRLAKKFAGIERIGTTYGSGQFDAVQDRRTARDRQLAADATLDSAGARLAKRFPGIEHIGVGEWPSRRQDW